MIRRRKSNVIAAVGTTIALALCSCGGDDEGAANKKPAPPVVEGYIVRIRNLDNSMAVTGTIIPYDETTLMPEISGRITMLNINEGGRVSKGTLLVKLFDGDLQAQLTKLQAQLSTAKETVKRLAELRKVNGVSEQEYNLAETSVKSLEADIALVNAEISRTEIRAPFDGVLGLRRVSTGAYVTAGTAIASIHSDKDMRIDFSVPENTAASIAPGMKLDFTVDGDTMLYHASVIASEQQVSAGSLSLQVRAHIEDHTRQFLPGTSALVHFSPGNTDSTLAIPATAIVPDARNKKVWVARNGKAEFIAVRTGSRTSESVQILSGLNAGDTVVTTGIQFMRKGMSLTFSSIH